MANKKYASIISYFRQGSPATKIFVISVAIYILSCLLPVATTRNETLFGLGCLLMGEFSFLAGDLVQLEIWSGNIFYAIGVLLYWKGWKPFSSIFAVIALIVGWRMLSHPYITYDTVVPINHFHIGYYLWMLSFGLLLIAGLLSIVFKK